MEKNEELNFDVDIALTSPECDFEIDENGGAKHKNAIWIIEIVVWIWYNEVNLFDWRV